MKTDPDPGEITALLLRWSDGDEAALDRLAPIIYQELRTLARSHMRRERRDHTLQPTALVHEVFLRLFNERDVTWRSRAHFFGIASKLMRRLLVDHARKRSALKRRSPSAGQESVFASVASDEQILAVDQALQKLEAMDQRKAQVVELRYFGGMTTEETADSLEISVASVERDWSMARAWLYRELKTLPARF